MMDEIPARVIRLFGNERARPKVTRVYNAETGWSAAAGTPILTWRAVDHLRSEGSTSAELRWRFRTRQVSILGMSRPADDESGEDARRGTGPARRGRGARS